MDELEMNASEPLLNNVSNYIDSASAIPIYLELVSICSLSHMCWHEPLFITKSKSSIQSGTCRAETFN